MNSWLGPLASGVGSVLGGISSSLVTMTPGGPIPSPNNAIIEPFSDVTPTSVDNEGCVRNMSYNISPSSVLLFLRYWSGC